jgi:hypothetical protein
VRFEQKIRVRKEAIAEAVGIDEQVHWKIANEVARLIEPHIEITKRSPVVLGGEQSGADYEEWEAAVCILTEDERFRIRQALMMVRLNKSDPELRERALGYLGRVIESSVGKHPPTMEWK